MSGSAQRGHHEHRGATDGPSVCRAIESRGNTGCDMFLGKHSTWGVKTKTSEAVRRGSCPPLGDVLEPLKRRELRPAVPAEPQVFILLDRLGYTGLRPPVSVNAFSRLMRL